MAAGRPHKPGLDFFPFDTDTETDKKIQVLEATHPQVGWYVWTKILPRLYRERGYFFEADEENLLLLSSEINVDINSLNAIINYMCKKGLFDAGLYQRFGILTSKRVQMNYLHATSRRKRVEIIHEFLLLHIREVEERNRKALFLIYDDINSIFVDKQLIPDYIKRASRVISFLFFYNEYIESNKLEDNKLSNGEEAVDPEEVFKQQDPVQQPGEPSIGIPPAKLSPINSVQQVIYDPNIPVKIHERPVPMNWSWECAYFQQSKKWIEEFCMSENVSEQEMRSYFPEFFKHLIRTDSQKEAHAMRKHFGNWWARVRAEEEQRNAKNKNREGRTADQNFNYEQDEWK